MAIKRGLIATMAFVVLLFATDELRAVADSFLYDIYIADITSQSWSTVGFHYLYLKILVYALPFFVAGAFLGWFAARKWVGVSLALLFGLIPSAVMIFSEPIRPFYYMSHASFWLMPLFWANWYMPALAAVLGALLGSRFSSKREMSGPVHN